MSAFLRSTVIDIGSPFGWKKPACAGSWRPGGGQAGMSSSRVAQGRGEE
jgi:hypothetical protein